MNKTREIAMTIETVRSGQPRPYADSYYEYILTVSGMSEWEVEQYCTKILHPNSQSYEDWNKGKENMGIYFGGYHTVSELAAGQYKYLCVEPFTD